MSTHPARDAVRRSMNAHRLGRKREALALAEAAHRMVIEIPGGLAKDGAVSAWFGYLLGVVGGKLAGGLEICRLAAAECFWEPRVYEYLARLEIEAGSRRRAVDALERGLAVSPADSELLALRRSLGIRRSPPVAFLDRNHPVNRWLGAFIARLNGSGAAALIEGAGRKR